MIIFKNRLHEHEKSEGTLTPHQRQLVPFWLRRYFLFSTLIHRNEELEFLAQILQSFPCLIPLANTGTNTIYFAFGVVGIDPVSWFWVHRAAGDSILWIQPQARQMSIVIFLMSFHHWWKGEHLRPDLQTKPSSENKIPRVQILNENKTEITMSLSALGICMQFSGLFAIDFYIMTAEKSQFVFTEANMNSVFLKKYSWILHELLHSNRASLTVIRWVVWLLNSLSFNLLIPIIKKHSSIKVNIISALK